MSSSLAFKSASVWVAQTPVVQQKPLAHSSSSEQATFAHLLSPTEVALQVYPTLPSLPLLSSTLPLESSPSLSTTTLSSSLVSSVLSPSVTSPSASVSLVSASSVVSSVLSSTSVSSAISSKFSELFVSYPASDSPSSSID